MKRNVKIAVGGYATKAVSDADILLHDYEDGVEGVELDTDGFDLKAFLRERVAGADKVEIYSTLSGRYSRRKGSTGCTSIKRTGGPSQPDDPNTAKPDSEFPSLRPITAKVRDYQC